MNVLWVVGECSLKWERESEVERESNESERERERERCGRWL